MCLGLEFVPEVGVPVSYSAAEALPPALATTQEHEEQKLQRSCRELRARLATGDAGIAAFGRAVRGPKVPWLRFSTSMGYYMLYICTRHRHHETTTN